MLSTDLFSFFVHDEELASSPSRADGIDERSESFLRLYGCELIQEASILLRLPQVVSCTGQVLFHRFYCKKSLKAYAPENVASACLYLAAKLEEQTSLKARGVILVMDRIVARREGRPLALPEPGGKEYDYAKVQLIKHERLLLKEFGFVTMVEHPHKFVFNLIEMVAKKGNEQILPGHPCHPLMQEAWNLLNDSYRTTVCVRFRSVVVACGVIFMAARRLKVPLPESPPWWEVCEVAAEDISKVCRALHQLYQMPKLESVGPLLDRKPRALPATPSTPGPAVSEPSPQQQGRTQSQLQLAGEEPQGATQALARQDSGLPPAQAVVLGPSPGQRANGATSGANGAVSGVAGDVSQLDKPTRSSTTAGKQQEANQQERLRVKERRRSRSRSLSRSRSRRSRSRSRDRSRRGRRSRSRSRDRKSKELRHKDRHRDREPGRGERERRERDSGKDHSVRIKADREREREVEQPERKRARQASEAGTSWDREQEQGQQGKEQGQRTPLSSTSLLPSSADEQQQQQQQQQDGPTRSGGAANGHAVHTPPSSGSKDPSQQHLQQQQQQAPNTADSSKSAAKNGLPGPLALAARLSARLERAAGDPGSSSAAAAVAAEDLSNSKRHTDLREKFRQFESCGKAGIPGGGKPSGSAALPPPPRLDAVEIKG